MRPDGATLIPTTEAAMTPDGRWLLRQPQFRAYWFARLCSQTAQGALLYGLLILIVDQTTKSVYASLFVACSIIPSLLFGIIGGSISDVLPQRAFLVMLNSSRTILVVLLLREQIGLPTIFAVTLGIWTIHQFHSPTESTVLARIVEPHQLPTANALYSLALTLAQLLGMIILAPGLLRIGSPRMLFVACAFLFAIAALSNHRMGRLPRHAKPPSRRSLLSLRGGWHVLVSSPQMYSAVLDAVLIGIGLSALVAIVPYYLTRVLDTGAENTVFVFAPAVIGVLAGLQLAPVLGRMVGYDRLATVGVVGFALGIAGLGLVDPVNRLLREIGVPLSQWAIDLGLTSRIQTAMTLSIPVGLFSSITGVAARTILLQQAPAHLRGQAAATQNTLANVGALVPTLLAGVAIDWFDVQPVALAIAVLLLVSAILGRRLGLVATRIT